ncbi:hypothetical protein BCR32DRAFT_328364 [Anaeromyces robustus]|uniref:Uncharacterized protein n=1 Tax=Anaeromyces robustus TaxID=1754192 RepID=A0A1Y1WZ72_9FUNG|nr:hypothetical protein BCR32DRAFT_328364 [Anaeromyces robustus]|eukprot:ORX78869.1 hypothetical protein BCR32DRAFT_328364 [Anaeromyces robustus]
MLAEQSISQYEQMKQVKDTSLTEEEIQKIKKSIEASDRAIFKLRKAIVAYDKAGSWGVVDILGGGLITSLIKRDKMDEARSHMIGAKNALDNLDRELRCLSDCAHFNFESLNNNNKYVRFADYFFDCGFVDLYVQSDISKGKKECRSILNKVIEIKALLEKQLTN